MSRTRTKNYAALSVSSSESSSDGTVQEYWFGLPGVFNNETPEQLTKRAEKFANTKTVADLKADLKKMGFKGSLKKKSDYVDEWVSQQMNHNKIEIHEK